MIGYRVNSSEFDVDEVPRLLPIFVTMLGGEKTRRARREVNREGRSQEEQRESPRVGGGNESRGGSRLSARALSISSASRRTRNYPSIERRSSLAQLTSISRGFFFSATAAAAVAATAAAASFFSRHFFFRRIAALSADSFPPCSPAT